MTSVKLLKIHKWWTSHYGTMMAFVYVVVAIGPSPPSLPTFLSTLGLFTLASLGIGTFGHLLNDVYDVSQDARSGAQNLVARMGPLGRASLFTAALVAGILPWWRLQTTPAIAALIAGEYVLFMLYSIPPCRLKNRGILGSVADSLYGYVVPNTVAVLLFAQLGGGVPPWLVAAIVIWAFFFGLDKIIEHQFVDESRDQLDGMKTFVVSAGWRPAFDTLLWIILPLEVTAFLALIACLGVVAPAIGGAYIVYLTVVLGEWRHRSLANTSRVDRLSPIDRVHVLSHVAMARFIWRWLPLVSLLVLVAARPSYLPLVVPHLILFPEPLTWTWHEGKARIRLLSQAA